MLYIITFTLAMVIFYHLTGDIDKLRDLEQECLHDYAGLKDHITRCRSEHDFKTTEVLIKQHQRRYKNVSAVRWTSADLHAILNNKRALLVR